MGSCFTPPKHHPTSTPGCAKFSFLHLSSAQNLGCLQYMMGYIPNYMGIITSRLDQDPYQNLTSIMECQPYGKRKVAIRIGFHHHFGSDGFRRNNSWFLNVCSVLPDAKNETWYILYTYMIYPHKPIPQRIHVWVYLIYLPTFIP